MIDCGKLINSKNSESLVILGSGYSINKIDFSTWEKIKKVDSIGFNWFCKSKFVPTHYLIREQANTSDRQAANENPKLLLNILDKDIYRNTFLIVLDVSHHSKNSFNYTNKFKTENQIVLMDRKKQRTGKVEYLKKDICKFGVFHGRCTLVSVLHIAIFLGYKKIYFAGVDLNNSRYFWLPKNSTRHTIKKKGKSVNMIHPIAGYTVRFITKTVRLFNDIEFYTINKRSLLRRVVEFGYPPYKK